MRSLIFKDWGVRAIQEGRKTMTRRIESKLKILNMDPNHYDFDFYDPDQNEFYFTNLFNGDVIVIKPRFHIDEVIYVKETYGFLQAGIGTIYRATEDDRSKIVDNKWRSPFFMKEEEARLFLKITDIKVERACDISDEDAQKEGVGDCYDIDYSIGLTYKKAFQQVWKDINGDSWNKWVFVYEFERRE